MRCWLARLRIWLAGHFNGCQFANRMMCVPQRFALALALLLVVGLCVALWLHAQAADGAEPSSTANQTEEKDSSQNTSQSKPSHGAASGPNQAGKLDAKAANGGGDPAPGADGGSDGESAHACGASCQHGPADPATAGGELTAVEKYSIKHHHFPPNLTPETLPKGHFKTELLALPRAIQLDVLQRLVEMKIPPINLHSLHVDSGGALFYACLPPMRPPSGEDIDGVRENASLAELSAPAENFLASGVAPSAVPISSPPQRSSRPGAPNTVYLDFNGHIVQGTQWNTGFGVGSWDCVAFDTDGDLATFSVAEQAVIVGIWERVAEDFAPFNVNVTTVEPASFSNRTVRALITRSTDRSGVTLPSGATAGGIAYVNVFNVSGFASLYSPAFTYYDKFGGSANDLATVTSHEIGHNLGLAHDGVVAQDGLAAREYYSGHGTGSTGWGPIMGGPFDRPMTHWSKGDYYRANQTQDDLAIIASKIGYRPDDYASTIQASLPLNGTSTGTIGLNTDKDVWYVDTYSQLGVQLAVGIVTHTETDFFGEPMTGGNLHGAVRVYNSQGALVADLTSASAPSVATNIAVAPGRYYIEVASAGSGSPLTPGPIGYTTYGSVGQYLLTVQTNQFSPPEQVTAVTLTALSSTTVRVRWDAAAGADEYKVLRNGELAALMVATSFVDQGLAPETDYTYEVVAVNDDGEAPSSVPAIVQTLAWIDDNPLALLVLTPSSPVTNSNSVFAFAGQAGAGLTNGVIWSNAASGQTGFFARARDWSYEVPLVPGTNVVSFRSHYVLLQTNTAGSDQPSLATYNSGWTSGLNGGSGFGPWSLSSSGNGGHFIASWSNNPNLSVGVAGFGLWANSGGVSTAARNFAVPLQVRGRFSVHFDNNWIDTNGVSSVGFALMDADNNRRFAFSFVGGQANYRIDDATANRDTGLGWTGDGLFVTFEITGDNSYSLTVGGSSFTGTLASGGDISRLVASNNNAGADGGYNFYLGSMELRSATDVPGVTETTAPGVFLPNTTQRTDGLPDVWWSEYGVPVGARLADGDHDFDGLKNAMEYFMGLDPTVNDSTGAVQQHVFGETVFLDYRRSKSHEGITSEVKWSTSPGVSASWSTEALSDFLLLDEGGYEWRRASMPWDYDQGDLFLRLDLIIEE